MDKGVDRLREEWKLEPTLSQEPIDLQRMSPPLPIVRIEPDQIIEDLLVATLTRVQRSNRGELAAAAARYLTLLREKAL